MSSIRARRPAVLIAAGLGMLLLVTGLVVTVFVAANRFAAKSQPDEILGTMRDVSDHSDLGGAATTAGTVLAVPTTALGDFWQRTSAGSPPPANELPYATFALPHTALPAIGGVAAPVEGGRFTLRPVAIGPYLLCYAQGADNVSYLVQGCAQVSLHPSGRLELSVGEAGFRAKASG